MKTIPAFAPMLSIGTNVTDVSFYEKAFGAVEVRRFSNDDGTIHVSEFTIGDAMFHLHEDAYDGRHFSPEKSNGTTVTIGLFVDDVQAMFDQAVAAGAEIVSPVKDYEYQMRQGELRDPFGHLWTIQKDLR
jgi:PhnB protein